MTTTLDILDTKFDNFEKNFNDLIQQVREICECMDQQKLYNLKDVTRFEELEKSLDELKATVEKTGDFQIEVQNGTKKNMWISDVVKDMYSGA